ncbi:hypothetical protein IMY05_C4637000300 [Salix suchowensis]|nr:hypothetical protein IMY05_C4637000300 [Salix suchowensis]
MGEPNTHNFEFGKGSERSHGQGGRSHASVINQILKNHNMSTFDDLQKKLNDALSGTQKEMYDDVSFTLPSYLNSKARVLRSYARAFITLVTEGVEAGMRAFRLVSTVFRWSEVVLDKQRGSWTNEDPSYQDAIKDAEDQIKTDPPSSPVRPSLAITSLFPSDSATVGRPRCGQYFRAGCKDGRASLGAAEVEDFYPPQRMTRLWHSSPHGYEARAAPTGLLAPLIPAWIPIYLPKSLSLWVCDARECIRGKCVVYVVHDDLEAK